MTCAEEGSGPLRLSKELKDEPREGRPPELIEPLLLLKADPPSTADEGMLKADPPNALDNEKPGGGDDPSVTLLSLSGLFRLVKVGEKLNVLDGFMFA